MKAASGALNALLNGATARSLWMAKCVQLDLAGGGYVLRYTDADVHLELPEVTGVRFMASGARVTFGPTRQVLGLEVDETSLMLAPMAAGGVDPGQSPALPASLSRVASNGGLDRALVTVWRAFHAAPGPSFGDLVPVDPNATPTAMLRRFTPTGALKWFVGYVAGVEVGEVSIELTVRSGLDLLNRPFPPHIYRAGCAWDLYSPGCGLQRSAWAQAGRIAQGSTRSRITATPLIHTAQAFDQRRDGYYNEGVLSVSNGPNAFVRRGIKEHHGGHFILARPLPYDPIAGNTISVVPGCDKTYVTCGPETPTGGKFNNQHNFRGFPHAPGPDALEGADIRDVTDEIPDDPI